MMPIKLNTLQRNHGSDYTKRKLYPNPNHTRPIIVVGELCGRRFITYCAYPRCHREKNIMSAKIPLNSTTDSNDNLAIRMNPNGDLWFHQDDDVVVLDSSQLDQLEQYLKGRRDRLVNEQMEANTKAYEDGTRPFG